MIGKIINQLILIAGAWQTAGDTDDRLEAEFEDWLNKLQKILKTDREGAVQYLIAAIGEKEEAA